jgi:hypothetical protein
MATNTPKLNLVKPDMADYADIRVLNQNMDILDREVGGLDYVKNVVKSDSGLTFTKKDDSEIQVPLNYMPTTGGNFTGDITVQDNPVISVIETTTQDEQSYIKYSDGTLITRINHNNVVGASWIVTFLVPFIDSDYSAVASAYGVGSSDYDNLEYCELNQKTNTSIEVKTSTRAGGKVATTYNLLAIGRWK